MWVFCPHTVCSVEGSFHGKWGQCTFQYVMVKNNYEKSRGGIFFTELVFLDFGEIDMTKLRPNMV